MSKKTLHYVIHSCGPQECDCSAVCNPREGDEIQATTDASKVSCGNCLRVMAKRKVPLASDQVARLQGPKSICDALQQQVEALRGLVPDMPPRPPEGDGLPRYGLRWNGPSQPLSVPMDDGYWTPWHLAYQQVESALEREQIALAHAHDPVPVLDDDLRYILGRPNFWCNSLANALRAMGQEIARKAEEEQAAVIHWLLKAYFEHGPGWREAVEKMLAAEREKELAKGGDK